MRLRWYSTWRSYRFARHLGVDWPWASLVGRAGRREQVSCGEAGDDARP